MVLATGHANSDVCQLCAYAAVLHKLCCIRAHTYALVASSLPSIIHVNLYAIHVLHMLGSLLHLLSPVEQSSLSGRRERIAAARNDVLCLIGKLCLKQVHSTVFVHHTHIVLRTVDSAMYGMPTTLYQEFKIIATQCQSTEQHCR
jgi:hypothetical protein